MAVAIAMACYLAIKKTFIYGFILFYFFTNIGSISKPQQALNSVVMKSYPSNKSCLRATRFNGIRKAVLHRLKYIFPRGRQFKKVVQLRTVFNRFW